MDGAFERGESAVRGFLIFHPRRMPAAVSVVSRMTPRFTPWPLNKRSGL
jgi:hypothetical protein